LIVLSHTNLTGQRLHTEFLDNLIVLHHQR